MQSPVNHGVAGSFLMRGADLRMLLRMRNVALLGQTIALIVTATLIEVELDYFSLGVGVALLAVFNLYWWVRLARTPPQLGHLDDRAFFFQILVDITVLTYLLHFAGGPTNPFHEMYLLPLTVAAAALPWTYTWRAIAASVSGYTLVAFYYVPIELNASRAHDLMVIGGWINHMLLSILVAYFVVRIAAELSARDRLLEEAHAKEVRNGCAVTLGSVAAGIVHELSTPLSTMMMLLSDMRSENADNPALQSNLNLMVGRLEECNKSLGGLRDFTNHFKHGDTAIPVEQFIENVANHFRHIRPGVAFKLSLNGPRPGRQLVSDLALQQAIINLLNNAADVSPEAVTLEANWTDSTLTLRVLDQGPGFSPDLANKLGEVVVTTKSQGTGVGLFLTNVTMHRIGGQLHLYNQDAGGACAELTLPFSAVPSEGGVA